MITFLNFFSIWVFFHSHSRITRPQEKGEGISLTPHYHLHPLHRHLDISRAIPAESSPLHIGSSRTRAGNLWFPSVSCLPLSTNLRVLALCAQHETLLSNFFTKQYFFNSNPDLEKNNISLNRQRSADKNFCCR